MNNKCEMNIQRDLLGRIKRITTKNCSDKQVNSALKKRNVNLREVNLVRN